MDTEFPELKNGFSTEYKNRLISSAVRGASLMHVLARSVNTRFDELNALNTGLLSALFDDMIDWEQEDFKTISKLIHEPDKTPLNNHNAKIARDLYLRLLANLAPWQKEQLSDILSRLLEVEKNVKTKKNGEWKKRGTYAFFVYLTIVCVKLKDVNQDVALKYGEYLQLLDDYEDYNDDDHHDNYFKIHPDFKLTDYFLNDIKPQLPSLFKCDHNQKFFSDFVENYHVFQTRSYKYKYEKENLLIRLRREWVSFVIRRLNRNVPF